VPLGAARAVRRRLRDITSFSVYGPRASGGRLAMFVDMERNPRVPRESEPHARDEDVSYDERVELGTHDGAFVLPSSGRSTSTRSWLLISLFQPSPSCDFFGFLFLLL